MNKKKQKVICFVLMLAIIVWGVYIEEIDTKMYIPHISMNEMNSYILSGSGVIMEPNACTAEMLGVRNCVKVVQVARYFTGKKRDSKISADILNKTIISQCWNKFSTEFEIVKYSGRYPKEVVLNYIHKSDGKKRS